MNEKLLNVLLILLVCIPMTSKDIIVPALPLMLSELNTHISTVELVISAYMLGFSISILTIGMLSDIYGRRVALIYTMLIYIVACLLIGFCHSILLLVILRFFQGLGGGSGSMVGVWLLKIIFKKISK